MYIGAILFVKMYQFWILSFPPLAYSYWVVFSLNISIGSLNKYFVDSFAKTKLVCHWCLCLFVQENLVELEEV